MINAVVIDEPSACESICTLLQPFSCEMQVCRTCFSVRDAIGALTNCKPQVVFMDVELPDGNAFDVLKNLPSHEIQIVFVTAKEEYALKAIKYHAYDYILKPIVADEFYHVVLSVLGSRKKIALHNLSHTDMPMKKIAIADRNGLQYHCIDDIVFIKGEGSYSKVYFKNAKPIVVSKLVKDFERSLPIGSFLRVHKSYFVNIYHITALKKDDSGYLIMSNEAKVPINIKARELILHTLGAFTAII